MIKKVFIWTFPLKSLHEGELKLHLLLDEKCFLEFNYVEVKPDDGKITALKEALTKKYGKEIMDFWMEHMNLSEPDEICDPGAEDCDEEYVPLK